MTKQSACLIFNPVAGQGNAEAELQRIRQLLDPDLALTVQQTAKGMNPTLLAEAAIREGATLLIASGGDGTLSDVAEAVVNTNIPLGIIPRGTANSFARSLGIPQDIEAACQTIVQGHTRTVDAALCNGKLMLLLTGIGLQAEMVAKADRKTKDRLGVIAYVIAGVQQLMQLPRFQAQIKTDTEQFICETVAITIANAAPATSVLAQGAPQVIVDDGLLDITLVSPRSKWEALAAGLQLLTYALRQTARHGRKVDYRRARSIQILADPPQKVAIDGDVIGFTPAEIKCLPQSLTVLVPGSL
ncbi:MAG TPA: YegS/Rv2252/BmrU family lipid kinase [Allocoleopsis sp.]